MRGRMTGARGGWRLVGGALTALAAVSSGCGSEPAAPPAVLASDAGADAGNTKDYGPGFTDKACRYGVDCPYDLICVPGAYSFCSSPCDDRSQCPGGCCQAYQDHGHICLPQKLCESPDDPVDVPEKCGEYLAYVRLLNNASSCDAEWHEIIECFGTQTRDQCEESCAQQIIAVRGLLPVNAKPKTIPSTQEVLSAENYCCDLEFASNLPACREDVSVPEACLTLLTHARGALGPSQCLAYQKQLVACLDSAAPEASCYGACVQQYFELTSQVFAPTGQNPPVAQLTDPGFCCDTGNPTDTEFCAVP